MVAAHAPAIHTRQRTDGDQVDSLWWTELWVSSSSSRITESLPQPRLIAVSQRRTPFTSRPTPSTRTGIDTRKPSSSMNGPLSSTRTSPSPTRISATATFGCTGRRRPRSSTRRRSRSTHGNRRHSTTWGTCCSRIIEHSRRFRSSSVRWRQTRSSLTPTSTWRWPTSS
jgi:hypothetical protein